MSTTQNFIEQLIIKTNPEIDNDGLDLLVEDVRSVLEEWVLNHIASKLTDKKLEEYMSIVKKWSEKENYEYLNKNIQDYDNFIEKVYLDFEKSYIDNFKHFYNKK
jgi:hypothetical protein